jgi:Bacterial Ig-like domain
LRKLAAAALAIPVLAALYVPILLRRSVVLRLVVGLGAVGLIGLGVLTFLSPRPTAAKAPTVSAPLDAASFAQTVDAAHRLHDPIRLGFSSPMNVASVAAALTVDPATPVTTSWDTAHRTLTISPRGMWQAGTFYTIKVAGAALDASGQPLGQAARALFNTRAATVAHLALSGSAPSSASPSAAFTVTFDSAVPAPAPDELLAISPAVTGTLTDVSTTTSGTSITFKPDKPLTAGVAYTVALQPGIVDADGSSVVAPEPLRITTAVPPQVVRFRPLNGTSAVPLGQVLSVRFTQAMDPATTTTAFQARIGTKVLAGKTAWAEKNTVLVFTPSTPLLKGSAVVMSVSTTALSATGVPLPVASTVSFHTIAPVAPAAKVKASKPKSGSGGSGGSGGSTAGAGAWHAVEVYYLGLMNCTRGGGWILSSGTCSSPGGSGVKPLILNAGISNKVSRPYAKLLATKNICTHFYGGNPGDRLHAAGYPGDYRENIGCRSASNPYASVLGTHLFFQDEKPCADYCHWANIMDPRVNEVGIGIWVIGDRVRLVVDFWKS